MTSIANDAPQDTDSDDSDDELDIFFEVERYGIQSWRKCKAKWRGWRRSRREVRKIF